MKNFGKINMEMNIGRDITFQQMEELRGLDVIAFLSHIMVAILLSDSITRDMLISISLLQEVMPILDQEEYLLKNQRIRDRVGGTQLQLIKEVVIRIGWQSILI